MHLFINQDNLTVFILLLNLGFQLKIIWDINNGLSATISKVVKNHENNINN